MDTAWRWARKAHEFDPRAQYFFFLWNSLKKAGATLAHGHAQVVLGRDRHYARVELLREAAKRYKLTFGSNYFDDLYNVHYDLGLAAEKDGNRLLAYLTPIKEKETIIISDKFDSSLWARIYEVLACFRDKLYVSAFNVGIAAPPLGSGNEEWNSFPVISRMVDRGYPWDGSSDFASMELFASSIISSDPFMCIRNLKESLYDH